MLNIEKRDDGWWILDPKSVSGFFTSEGLVTEFGPYSSEEKAIKQREILYHIIYGNYS